MTREPPVGRVPLDLDSYLTDLLAPDLEGVQSDRRLAAIQVLARFGQGERVRNRLGSLAESDPDPAVSRAAQEGLQSLSLRGPMVLGDAVEFEAIARFIGNDSPIVRMHGALRTFGLPPASGPGDPRILDLLLSRLDQEKDSWVLCSIVGAVGIHGKSIHVPRIQRFLGFETHPRLVASTVDAICALDPELGFTLVTPLLKCQDSRIRANAVFAMYQVERGAALETLESMARSDDRDVREAASHCLGRLATESSLDLLLEMHERERDPVLAVRIEKLIRRSGNTEALTRLVDKRRGAGPAASSRSPRTPAPAGRDARPATPSRSPETRRPGSWNPLLIGGGAALLLTGFLMVALVTGRDDGELSHEAGEVAGATLDQIAAAPQAARYRNRPVTWEGTVLNVDAGARSLRVEVSPHEFAVGFDRRLPDGLTPGDRVRVAGRILARSRFGPVYLRGHALEVLR